MSSLFYVALLTGLAGSLHCLGMCGPLVLALPTGQMSPARANWARLGYTLGRISVYATLGAVSGWLGWRLSLSFVPQAVSIGAGLLLLVGQLPVRCPLVHPGQVLFRSVHRVFFRLTRQRTVLGITALGVVNGLLPCGMVYAALAGAAATVTPLSGGVYMVVFGLGTAPALWLISMAKPVLWMGQIPLVRRLVPYFGILVALLLVGRGYFGPTQAATTGTAVREIPLCIGHPAR